MLKESPLGKTTEYIETYTPDLLFPIPRSLGRNAIGLTSELPFWGEDIWNGYEISWLNLKGKPEIALGVFQFPCDSTYVIESKSFKLYLNSFNQSCFSSISEVEKIIQKDLSKFSESDVIVSLRSLSSNNTPYMQEFEGECIDSQEIETNTYQVNKDFLCTTSEIVEENLYSHLLKSNCLATGQPDWGSVLIRYKGRKIDRQGLLKYIISYRQHAGFHEHCVEQMFFDLLTLCEPEQLSVYARYTRRGGLDINPFRSNFEKGISNLRHIRQ